MKIINKKKPCSMGSYRLWLYGCNIFLVFVVLIFATMTWFTLNESRMTLIPLDKWEALVVLIYIGSVLQMIDVLLCFYGVWSNNIQLVFIYWVILLLLSKSASPTLLHLGNSLVSILARFIHFCRQKIAVAHEHWS